MADTLKEFINTEITGSQNTTHTTSASQQAVIKNVYFQNPSSNALKFSVEVDDKAIYKDITVAKASTAKLENENIVLDNSSTLKITNGADPFAPSILADPNSQYLYGTYPAIGFFNDDPDFVVSQSVYRRYFIYNRASDSFVSDVNASNSYFYPQTQFLTNDDAVMGWVESTGSGNYKFNFFSISNGSASSIGQLGGDVQYIRYDDYKLLAQPSQSTYILAFPGVGPRAAQVKLVLWSGTNAAVTREPVIYEQGAPQDISAAIVDTTGLTNGNDASVAYAFRDGTSIKTGIHSYNLQNIVLSLQSFDCTDSTLTPVPYQVFDVDSTYYGILWRDRLTNGDMPIVYSKINKSTGAKTDIQLYADRYDIAGGLDGVFNMMDTNSNDAIVDSSGNIHTLVRGTNGRYKMEFNDTGVVSLVEFDKTGFVEVNGARLQNSSKIIALCSDDVIREFDGNTGMIVKVDGVEIT